MMGKKVESVYCDFTKLPTDSGKHIVQKQIEIVPFDKVMMLASSTIALQCKHTNGFPYGMPKGFWFSVVAERKTIIDLAKEMHSKPR